MRWAGFVAGLGVVFPAAVAAQPPSVCTIDLSTFVQTLECTDATPCTTDGACPLSTREYDSSCRIVDHDETVVLRYCAPACSTIFECGTVDDCPSLIEGEIASDCVEAPILTTSGGTVRLCEYAGRMFRLTYCSSTGPGSPEERFLSCFLFGGERSYDWRWGDCDRDGCQNGADSDPCDESINACSALITLAPECFLRTGADGGIPLPDGGSMPPPDATVGDDGGLVPDAGDMDAGNGIDADHPPTGGGPRPDFRGRGGGCSTAGPSPLAGWPLALLLLAIRRGSARRRREGR